jgi:Family of unknown function (DUF5880)
MATKRSSDEVDPPAGDDSSNHKHARTNGTYLGFDGTLEVGHVVKCILLSSAGSYEEKALDICPKLGQVIEAIGGPPQLEFAYDNVGISVITCKTFQGDSNIPINKHKLQPPLKHAKLRGDILLVKKNANSMPVNLSVQEWQDFMALDIPDDDDINDGEDGNEADEDEGDDEQAEQAFL